MFLSEIECERLRRRWYGMRLGNALKDKEIIWVVPAIASAKI